MRKALWLVCGLLLAAASVEAQTIAQWTFETSYGSITGSVSGTSLSGILPEIGTGSTSGVHGDAATVWSSPSGNGSPHSFSANHWGVGDYWEFQTSTVGYNNILLSYDQTSSNTGHVLRVRFGSGDQLVLPLVLAEGKLWIVPSEKNSLRIEP